MKKAIFFGFLSLFNFCGNKPKPCNFTITMTSYWMGHVYKTITVNNDSIIAQVDNFNRKIDTFSKSLTIIEKNRLCSYLQDFPIAELDSQYTNPLVLDGTQINFNISINNNSKGIYISNFLQKDLSSLSKKIDNFLPSNFRMGYYE